ncbi:related to NCE102 protein [Cephalotrichum gorgonifer]|uniref:Related to NCE102 protein n=1 Tax=Cephalotrichum gorgonifer TaxID=2041049 RepID=A0AAE8N5M4_9PEZI|nr:related to NCE102 protein [Cephalotrichum gorgonifer]
MLSFNMELGLLKTALRGLQLLWCLILIALIGNVIALSRNPSGSSTAAVNFTMFVIVASTLAAVYGLLARFFPSVENPKVALPADVFASLLTFLGGVVLSAKLGVVNCGDLERLKGDKGLPGSWIGWGSADDEKRCREIQAGAAFMWFLFFCFVGSAVFTWRDSRRGFSSIASSLPPMSQLGV